MSFQKQVVQTQAHHNQFFKYLCELKEDQWSANAI